MTEFEKNLYDNNIYEPQDIDRLLTKFKGFKTGGKNPIEYIDVPIAFDIETSSFVADKTPKACLVCWQIAINGAVIIGRSWNEALAVFDRIAEFYTTNANRRVIIYVHNLEYEFQWLRKRIKWTSVFATEKRRVIYALAENGIEFRCSYILSGYSLKKVGEELVKYKVEKKDGDWNYKLKRHSHTPLTDDEIGYAANDVRVVSAYIKETMEHDGHLKDIPLTRTGYVRQLLRKAVFADYQAKNNVRNLRVTPSQLSMLIAGFQGGFTHACMYNSGKRFQNVTSMDLCSSYPTVMIAEKKYPMSSPVEIKNPTKDQFWRAIENNCVLFQAEFHNLRAKPLLGDHPLSSSKCFQLEGGVIDNGRVISAVRAVTILTEIDFYVMRKFYEFDELKVGRMLKFRAARLPRPIVETVLSLYEKKTELKDIEGFEVEYQVIKGMLNACFGCSCENPVREKIECIDGDWIDYKEELKAKFPNPEEYRKELDKLRQTNLIESTADYNTSWSRFLYYAWSLWITSYARCNLFSAIYACSKNGDYLYSDTDSVKILNAESHKDYFDRYNAQIIRKLEDTCRVYGIDPKKIRPKNKDGEEKPLGVWSFDGFYREFKTLGAKRYMGYKRNKKGEFELEITIAGVGKKKGAEYLSTFPDPIEAFDDQFDFPPGTTGKQGLVYIDEPSSGTLTDYTGITADWSEETSVYMEEIGYKLSLDTEYRDSLAALGNIIIRERTKRKKKERGA